jgi:dihydroneopterin aldolase
MGFKDLIGIRGLEVNCVVGVYPDERDTPQPLLVEVEMRLDTEKAAVDERLRATVDYAAIAAQIRFLLESCRFHLLETAAHVLCRYLLLPPTQGEGRAQIDEVKIRLSKPGALEGKAVPTVSIDRPFEWARLNSENRDFGTVDIVFEIGDTGIYRLNLAPGKSIAPHIHRIMHESEMALSDGLICRGEPIGSGTIRKWAIGTPHNYVNPTNRYQSILCVDTPAFIASDEIRVNGQL